MSCHIHGKHRLCAYYQGLPGVSPCSKKRFRFGRAVFRKCSREKALAAKAAKKRGPGKKQKDDARRKKFFQYCSRGSFLSNGLADSYYRRSRRTSRWTKLHNSCGTILLARGRCQPGHTISPLPHFVKVLANLGSRYGFGKEAISRRNLTVHRRC